MILHILTRSEWDRAVRLGAHAPKSIASEGFVHCSTLEQAVPTANAIFRGQRDLVLLCINERRLEATLRFEPGVHNTAGDALFPHVYGPINLDAVTQVVPFPCGTDGLFSLPPFQSAETHQA